MVVTSLPFQFRAKHTHKHTKARMHTQANTSDHLQVVTRYEHLSTPWEEFANLTNSYLLNIIIQLDWLIYVSGKLITVLQHLLLCSPSFFLPLFQPEYPGGHICFYSCTPLCLASGVLELKTVSFSGWWCVFFLFSFKAAKLFTHRSNLHFLFRVLYKR